MASRPLVLVLGASFAAVLAVAACGGSNSDVGPGDGGPGADGAPGTDGASGDAATDGTVDGADAADGSLSCDDLSLAYGEDLPKTQACNTTSLVNECTAARERILGCGCITYVNANGVAALDKLAAAWTSQGCGPAPCPKILCKVATGGSCTGGGGGGMGTCVDTF